MKEQNENAARRCGILSPWELYAKKLEALFARDQDVTVRADFRNQHKSVRLLVRGEAKAEAIARLLPARMAFGAVEVAVEVAPANGEPTPAALLAAAFAGNSAFAGADETPGSEGARARSGSSPQIRRSSGAIMSRPMWARELKRPLRGRQKAA